jgi:cellulose synthase/poly-beta-1,6-N-acetylglucosamine synthase-like glycosyltransferase
MVITLLLIVFLCALAVIYPYAIYGIILKLLPDRSIARKKGFKISATLVFCAYNEEAIIPAKIKNIEKLKKRHPDLEVLAFDDGSSDATYDMLSERSDLLTVIQGSGRNGKAHGMKLLASRANGDIMIFTDANVTLRENAIDALMAWYADPEVGGICGSLHYMGSDNSSTASVGSLYWRLEERLKSEESRTGNVMGSDGSIFSLRRSLYPEFPNTVLDDLTVSMAAVFNGKRLIKADDVIAYEKHVAERSEEISRKIRISARAFYTHMHLLPQLRKMSGVDKFKYRSRKLLRWFGCSFFIVGTICFVLAVTLLSPVSGAVCTGLLCLLFFAGMRLNSGILSSIMEVVVALVATQIGVFHAMRGRTYAVWNPAKSR